MTREERRNREREQRRHEIVLAAERVFESRGYEAASMREVAEEAEVSKGALYLHFKSKEALFGAVLERHQRRSLDQVTAAAERYGTGLAKLWRVSKSVQHFIEEHRDYARALMALMASPDVEQQAANMFSDRLAELAAAETRLLEAVIATGVADGSLRPDLSPSRFSQLWAGLLGVSVAAQVEHCGPEKPQPSPDALSEFVETMLRGWAARPDDVAQLAREPSEA